MSETIIAPSGGGTSGGSTPTGTGFRHVTAGVEDGASKLVDTADVNDNQITYAKMQDVSATSRLLGRLTSGAGDVEELTGAQAAGIIGALSVYNRSTGSSYNTDLNEHTLYSFTVTGGDLSTNKALLIFLGGNMLFNSGSPTITMRVKLGTTTLWGDVSAAITLSATRRPWNLWVLLGNTGANNAQACYGIGSLGSVNAASVAGIGEIALPGTAQIVTIGPFRGTAAENSANNLTLAITNQFSVSNAAVEAVVDYAVALLL